jgi:hypothetical protein
MGASSHVMTGAANFSTLSILVKFDMRGNTLIAMRLIIVVIMRGSGAVAIRGFELLLQCAGAVLFSCAGSRLLLCVGAVLPPLPPPAAGLPPEVFPLLATSSPSPIDEARHGRREPGAGGSRATTAEM